MANQELLEILKQGVEVWNKWKEENVGIDIDLSDADLSGANLFGANLSKADLTKAELRHANLSEANLREAKIESADLFGANLSNANLTKADLKRATLMSADLRAADLTEAILWDVNLHYAKVGGAKIGWTVIAYTNLSNTEGLEEVIHKGPSHISTSTLQTSGGKIPMKFLRGCGLSDWEIESAKLYRLGRSVNEVNNIVFRILKRWIEKEQKAITEREREEVERQYEERRSDRSDGAMAARGGRSEERRRREQLTEYEQKILDIPLLMESENSVLLRRTDSIHEQKDKDLIYIVHFAVTSLPAVLAGSHFKLDFWMHLEYQREEMIRQARQELGAEKIQISSEGPIEIPHGTELTVEVNIEGMQIHPPRKNMAWVGEISKAGFIATVPPETEVGSYLGTATVYFQGLQIAQVCFVIEVGDAARSVQSLPVDVKIVRKAFASYSSKDRDEVLGRIQGMQKILPSLKVFVDVVSLRSGQYWEKMLWKEIPTYDVFYLFWSANANKSSWVDKEWRCALKTRGLDYIDPVPLVSPEEAPPPPELASKHFNDWMLPYMRAKENLD